MSEIARLRRVDFEIVIIVSTLDQMQNMHSKFPGKRILENRFDRGIEVQ